MSVVSACKKHEQAQETRPGFDGFLCRTSRPTGLAATCAGKRSRDRRRRLQIAHFFCAGCRKDHGEWPITTIEAEKHSVPSLVATREHIPAAIHSFSAPRTI
jgi:hypothetical protein